MQVNRIHPAGDRALLVELTDNADVHTLARGARTWFGEELADVVPGHVTVLLVWRDGPGVGDATDRDLMPRLRECVHALQAGNDAGPTAATSTPVQIPVTYDGADLAMTAATLGLSAEALVELHSGTAFRVAFMGFSPGFPYLVADPEDGPAAALLALPRLATPRTSVPAGSVAVAAGYCGIYPRSSPGGWNLLGRTDVSLFDPGGRPPALLEPGVAVRFVRDVRGSSGAA